MYPLTRHLQKTAAKIDECMGWTVGCLVIEPDGAYIQHDDGKLVPIPQICHIEVRNDGQWQTVPVVELSCMSTDGWPLFGGLDVRMKSTNSNVEVK